ncbi:dnaJ homolog subfamily C member 11 [Agrilus planipennis]|uniref:DnaJ homolog subfamily C member 11 n=1 Tax=Agrilus planipennis TaxID=224129 RepID=A0A7F5R3N8_AGRPL|nr:dnaJ homolog subfamily C member 11 [Agrilus planipennis]XP_025829932.1 dnaJ homolog subfamily C member 11 [Agrilus planipennis]XP_025829935.1 dnaJ homolog subfamily C member 11 [Agrilus planipennis]
MDFDSDDESALLQDDYYAFLNISKEATKEEINNAYRRLSRIYHPDKHLDPEKKQKAEILFNKTKKAYEVLSDPHQRAIYDNLGVKGLETEGWEIVQRTKTPAEIRAEYEQLAEERAERRKQQRTNPHGSITVNINATDLFNPYINEYGVQDEYEIEENSVLPNIEVSGMSFNQSVEFPLTQKDTATLSGQLQTHNGTGGGVISLSCRHIFSHRSWGEMEIGAGNGPSVSLKAFRTLSKRFFWNGGTVLQFTPQGIRPGFISTLAMQIDKHSVGYFTYNTGYKSSVSTSVIRDTETGLYNFSVQVGLPHSYISFSYTRKMLNHELRLRVAFKVGTFGGVIEYGAEKKVSKHSLLAAAVAVGVPAGVKLKIKLTRANQVYSFPIHLCEEVMPAPVFYGTIVPLIVYAVIKKSLVEPFLKEQEAKRAETEKQNNRTKLLEKRKEAQAAVELMSATYARIVRDEDAKKGLVIEKALYGKALRSNNRDSGDFAEEILDVTIPLQCLVKDSKLELHNHTKVRLHFFQIKCVL